MRNNLIAERKKMRISQEHASRAVGLSLRNYQRIEAGFNSPRLNTVLRICRFYQKPIEYIFDDNELENKCYLNKKPA